MTRNTGAIGMDVLLLPQEFGYTDLGELQFEEDLCLDVSSSKINAHVQILTCHGLGGNQKWEYNNQVGDQTLIM